MSITRNEIKKIKSLRTGKFRKAENMFPCEGIRLLEESLHFRTAPKVVYFSEYMLNERGFKLIERFKKRKVPVYDISASDMKTVSDTGSPQGILAVFETPSTDLFKLYRPDYRKLLLCENISDPGNLGTLIRSAVAFGFEMVILYGQAPEPYAPKVVRSTAGAIFAVKIAVVDRTALPVFVKKERIRLIATDMKGKDCNLILKKSLNNRKLMLAIGSEADGLSREILDNADDIVRIGHLNHVESLNAAVAGSIIMKQIYDLYRR